MYRRRCFLGIGGRTFQIEEGAFGDRRGAFGVKDVFAYRLETVTGEDHLWKFMCRFDSLWNLF